jgi:hypothetical protein
MAYHIYPTLIDSFNYFNAFPSVEKEEELMNKINRVKVDLTNQAQIGVAFENLINSIIKEGKFKTSFDGFSFKENIIREVLKEIEHDEPQKYVSGTENINGIDVTLYGFVDYYRPAIITDLKTTSKYKSGKYKYHTQRHIYPLCMDGIKKTTFLVTDFEDVVRETYFFSRRESLKVLSESIPRLIDFIESRRHLITDTKIFGL